MATSDLLDFWLLQVRVAPDAQKPQKPTNAAFAFATALHGQLREDCG